MAMDISVPEVDKKNDLDYWPSVFGKNVEQGKSNIISLPSAGQSFRFSGWIGPNDKAQK